VPRSAVEVRRLLKISFAGGAPAYVQIENGIADAIAATVLVPGDRLPAEHNLADDLDVSRMTLRHALERLEQRGLVTRRVGRGGGTFVARPKIELDLTTLAGFSEQLRRRGMAAGAEILSARRARAERRVARPLGLRSSASVYEIARLRTADREPIALEHSYLPASRFPGLLDLPLDASLYDLLGEHYGNAPVEAVEKLEALAAGGEEATLLRIKVGSPLFQIERIAYDADGTPVEFAHDRFRGDRTRLVFGLPGKSPRHTQSANIGYKV
jgi:GntR family transcriptional regulator